MPELHEWDSFYVIVGAAAGALVGLQFVVMTLIAERPPRRAAEAGAAFVTPTIVHFSIVMVLSAALTAPWHGIGWIAAFWGAIALLGAGYVLLVARRMQVQTSYQPAREDWWFHALLPLVTYVLLAISALTARAYQRESLFGVGAVTLLLLLIGIHNAWDAITYQVLANKPKTKPGNH